ncbi:hypothetical protein E9230_002207 [Corynebacterium glutamicum]|nr:hypothetical protein [Corynebacterium glutamicum]
MSLSLRSILNPIGIADTPGLLTQTPVLRTALITQLTSQRGGSCLRCLSSPLRLSLCTPSGCPLQPPMWLAPRSFRWLLSKPLHHQPDCSCRCVMSVGSLRSLASRAFKTGVLRGPHNRCDDSSLPAALATRLKAFTFARLLLRSSNSRISSRSPLSARDTPNPAPLKVKVKTIIETALQTTKGIRAQGETNSF